MKMIRFGRTELSLSAVSFGALPIQRVTMAEASRLISRAVEAGINFFDTARMYSDSEEKLGATLVGRRQQLVIASKTTETSYQGIMTQLETSLRLLKTDYIDLYQFHNPDFLPQPGQENQAYEAMVEARRQGKIRFIGFTNHRLELARQAVVSGWYDALQFPLSHISSEADLALIDLCRQHDLGILAMKALCGGLLTNIPAAFAFLRSFDNLVPIWGIQRESELAQFVALEANPPVLDAGLWQAIAADRAELAANFCRGCGYCLPCPADIQIPTAARMRYLLRRAPWQQFLTPQWQERMERISSCSHCGSCAARCPYGIDTPALLQTMQADYLAFRQEKLAAGELG